VHLSYFERVTDGWVIADGGRCYKADEAFACISKKYRCNEPECLKWCHDRDAYVQHWEAKHRFQPED